MEITIDSGAANHVMSSSLFPEYEILDSPGSIAGQRFVAAGGQRLANQGEKHLHVYMTDGTRARMVMQITDVNRSLASVGLICENNNEVIFRKDGGVIRDLKTGKEIKFDRKGGVYALQVWVQTELEGKAAPILESFISGFGRPGTS